MTEEQLRKIETAFSQQAPHFDAPTHTMANPNHLEWILRNLSLNRTQEALDVAAGTGLLGRAIAPEVKSVIALEATESMAERGRRACEEAGIANLEFRRGYAEALPFPDDRFDLVVCRLALHHFAEVAGPLREMKRVLKSAGTVTIIDLVSPEESEVAETYNQIERMRDPSHVRALGRAELFSAIEAAGLVIERSDTRTIEVDGESWLAFTGCSGATRQAIVALWNAEAQRDRPSSPSGTPRCSGARTGMHPVWSGTAWRFHQRWTMVSATKD